MKNRTTLQNDISQNTDTVLMIQKLVDYVDSNPCDDDHAVAEPSPSDDSRKQTIVELVDGTQLDLQPLDLDQLNQMQWEQETAFAKLIKQSTKGSPERTQVISKAYETVCTILSVMSEKQGDADFAMGMDNRYTDMVLKRLARNKKKGLDGGLFEVGFGSGLLLKSAEDQGYKVGGLEVAPQLFEAAANRLSDQNRQTLCLGEFTTHESISKWHNRFSVVYWNDVFEHIPVDEIGDYLQRIHDILAPGGELISITPNWHMRPMDVTDCHLPPRSTAVGFHLKEYTLREVTTLLRETGFSTVTTPLFVGKNKIVMGGLPGVEGFKRMVEPLMEYLPYPAAVQCCRRFGYCCTIATK